MPVKVGMISLGCPKNQVDGEMLMASLKAAGYQLSDDVGLSDVAIINTCGFIESAKQESIDEVLELAKLKAEGRIRALIVTGCLAERYREEVLRELPEADAVVGIGANGEIADIVARVLDGERVGRFPEKDGLPMEGDRELSTPSYFAYLKIAEGCDNRCAYCAIPEIRGRYRSRPMESVVEEARRLAADGAKELILVAQDTTRYGLDLYGRLALPELLDRLCEIEGIRWLRLLYCYPDLITDALIRTIAAQEKVAKYLDIPLQHVSDRVLRAMHRRGSRAETEALIRRLRQEIPGITLRTTVMVGYPGETEADFDALMAFIREVRFERLGCFAYSCEEGTPAASLPGQIEPEVKERRAELVYEEQMRIMQEHGEAMAGRTVTVMTEGFDRYAECYFGRTEADGPEIDGKVFFTVSGKKPYFGQFVEVEIEDCMDCDLIGHIAGQGEEDEPAE